MATLKKQPENAEPYYLEYFFYGLECVTLQKVIGPFQCGYF